MKISMVGKAKEDIHYVLSIFMPSNINIAN